MTHRMAATAAIAAFALAAGVAPACAADALQPSDFVAQFPLADVKDGLNAVELTEAVYRAATQRSLRDLRVFNANGEALPHALLPPLPPPEPSFTAVDLTLAPLPRPTEARTAVLQAYALRFERDRDRAVIELRGDGPSPASAAGDVGAYLIDARPLKDRAGRLLLAFAADAPDFAGHIEVAGSDDLVQWRVLARGALARDRRLGDVIEKNRIELRAPPPFLRIMWDGATAPRLAAARFEEPAPAAHALPRSQLAASIGSDPRTLYVDVPPALPIERLFVRMPQSNSVQHLTVYRHVAEPAPRTRRLGVVPRRAPEQWVHAGELTAFRVVRDGVEVEAAPLPFTAVTDRLRIQAGEPFAGEAPRVEAEWRPARIAFAARAPGPFRLAAGQPDAAVPPSLDLRGMLPADDASGATLPVARIEPLGGLAADGAAAAHRAERIAAQAHWSRTVLWVVLGAAVAGLGWMAWKLASQLRGAARADARR